MNQRVRKAIFPVGGLGTRFLPATKAMPKEMLTLVDKPLIHYAVEEAAAAGVEEFILVSSRSKTAMEDHFDFPYELARTLEERGKKAELEALEKMLPAPGTDGRRLRADRRQRRRRHGGAARAHEALRRPRHRQGRRAAGFGEGPRREAGPQGRALDAHHHRPLHPDAGDLAAP